MIRRNFLKKTALAGTAISAVPSFAFCSKESTALKDAFASPLETDEILANPDVGWQTFGRTSKMDKNLPSWIPSTVCYYRWGWDKFEPVQGQVDTAFFDQFLKDAHDSGQTLAFRVMTTYPGRTVYPAWLKDIGGKIDLTTVFIDGENHTDNPIPDFNDEIVMNAHNNFIRKLGELYDGHPDIAHVDLGTVGWWGEWHLSGQKIIPMPTAESMKKIVDAYVNAFTKTPLVIPIGASNSDVLEYASSKGVGWRADCFGDMNWHMPKYYTQALAGDNALDAWKKAPVAWESCWHAQHWVDEGWPLRFIFNYGIALHGSVLNNKSAVLPAGEEVKSEIKRFLQRLGYRFVLKEISHSSKADAGKPLEISLKWQNKGSAPCYKPYRLAFMLYPEAGGGKEYVMVGKTSADSWMPGDMKLVISDYLKNPVDLPDGDINEISESITIPADIVPGSYRLSVGIIENENDPKPVVQLGIKGRTNAGWYPVTSVKVSRAKK